MSTLEKAFQECLWHQHLLVNDQHLEQYQKIIFNCLYLAQHLHLNPNHWHREYNSKEAYYVRRKQKRDSGKKSSDDASAKFSLQDSKEIETFSDLEEQHTPLTPLPQFSSFHQNLRVEDYVLVKYDSDF